MKLSASYNVDVVNPQTMSTLNDTQESETNLIATKILSMDNPKVLSDELWDEIRTIASANLLQKPHLPKRIIHTDIDSIWAFDRKVQIERDQPKPKKSFWQWLTSLKS